MLIFSSFLLAFNILCCFMLRENQKTINSLVKQIKEKEEKINNISSELKKTKFRYKCISGF